MVEEKKQKVFAFFGPYGHLAKSKDKGWFDVIKMSYLDRRLFWNEPISMI